ncbi:hypothetical protein, partial [Escherichia coli]|uniref:hypothetical protein n=1 Tax=Escherichia coli TaxID=562 RepID=UPI001BD41DCE
SIASMASDGFIHVFPVKKTKPRTPERWQGTHGDNICLKLFGMQVYAANLYRLISTELNLI